MGFLVYICILVIKTFFLKLPSWSLSCFCYPFCFLLNTKLLILWHQHFHCSGPRSKQPKNAHAAPPGQASSWPLCPMDCFLIFFAFRVEVHGFFLVRSLRSPHSPLLRQELNRACISPEHVVGFSLTVASTRPHLASAPPRPQQCSLLILWPPTTTLRGANGFGWGRGGEPTVFPHFHHVALLCWSLTLSFLEGTGCCW